MKVIIGVSKRHAHLTEEVFKKLFGDIELEERNPIGQPGQFASTSTVDIKHGDRVLERVRIVGPFREQSQIEISASDAEILGVKPPRRISGNLDGSMPVTLVGPLGEITLEEGLILAEKHAHFTPEEAAKLEVETGDFIYVIKNGKKLLEMQVRVDEQAALEIHVDSDEAIEFGLKTGEEVDVTKCGK